MPNNHKARRSLLFYLGVVVATAILWLFVTLSEHHSYSTKVTVQWRGVDTARYVVVRADTSISYNIVSNGFLAIGRIYAVRHTPLVIEATSDTVVSAADCVSSLMRQFGFVGVHEISCRTEGLSLTLAERAAKPFVPEVRGVDVGFAHPYALYGDIKVWPDTVWLYGSAESLAKIGSIHTVSTVLANVRTSAEYDVKLDPVWQAYPDIRVSTPVVRLTVPTERFTEKRFSLPVALLDKPDDGNVRLYPETVEVTVMVAEKDYAYIDSSQIVAAVRYNNQSDQLPVFFPQFPSSARIKSVEPEQLSYVLIHQR